MSEDFRLPVIWLLTVRNITRSIRTPLLVAISLAQRALWARGCSPSPPSGPQASGRFSRMPARAWLGEHDVRIELP